MEGRIFLVKKRVFKTTSFLQTGQLTISYKKRVTDDKADYNILGM